ncbi:MAG: hypothetical protein AB7U82_02030 [Blastocatellales bacterium]
MVNQQVNKGSNLSKGRAVAALVAIPALVSVFAAHQQLLSPEYCCMPWSEGHPNRPPTWIFLWRNYSLLLTVTASIASLPRWQSWVGLAGTALFLFLYGSQ